MLVTTVTHIKATLLRIFILIADLNIDYLLIDLLEIVNESTQ